MLGSPRLFSSDLRKGLLMQGRIVLQAPLHKEAEHRDKKSVWQTICAYIVSNHTKFRLKCSGSFMPHRRLALVRKC